MNLQPINPPDTRGQVVTCYRCNRRLPLRECMADLDGPAFQAYYCPTCMDWGQDALESGRWTPPHRG